MVTLPSDLLPSPTFSGNISWIRYWPQNLLFYGSKSPPPLLSYCKSRRKLKSILLYKLTKTHGTLNDRRRTYFVLRMFLCKHRTLSLHRIGLSAALLCAARRRTNYRTECGMRTDTVAGIHSGETHRLWPQRLDTTRREVLYSQKV